MFFLKILNRLIEYSFCSLFFLVPLLMTPWNYELFEFNKMLLVYFFTIIIVGSWLAKMLLEKTIKIKRTPLDLSLLIFLIFQIISTVFSIHPHTSIWGYYSRFHGGLASTFAYLLLYYSFVSNLNAKKVLKTLYFLLASSLLVSLYGILERFGIDKKYWIQDVQNRVFSTLGQPNWLAAFLASVIPLLMALISIVNSRCQKAKTQIKKQKFLEFSLSLCLLIFYLCLLYTKSKSGLIGLLVGLLVFLFFYLFNFRNNFRRKKLPAELWQNLGFLLIPLLVPTLILGTEYSPSLTKIIQKFLSYPAVIKQEVKKPLEYAPKISESSDIRKVVWQGAISMWLDNPKTILIGDGVETFGYAYYQHRPASHNLLSEWDFLYNKAHNEYLNFLANTGLLGLLSYLAVIGGFVYWNLKKLKVKKENLYFLNFGIFAGYTTILVTNFFGFSVVIIGLLFFLLPAFSFILSGKLRKSYQFSLEKYFSSKSKFKTYIPFLLLLVSTFYILYSIFSLWIGDYFFAKGKNYSDRGYPLKAVDSLKKAIFFNKSEAIFHSELAETAALLASNLLDQEKENLNFEEINRWKELALKEIETSYQLNPHHLNIVKSQVKVFLQLVSLDPQFLTKAYQTLEEAIKISPTDASLYYNQAIVLNNLGENEAAIKVLKAAVSLKPDYRQAHYALALLLKENNQPEEAKKEFLFILEKIDAEDQAALKELEEIDK